MLQRRTIALGVVVWSVGTVAVLSVWSVAMRGERLTGNLLLVRLLVFLGVGALLGLLVWRLQTRRGVQG